MRLLQHDAAAARHIRRYQARPRPTAADAAAGRRRRRPRAAPRPRALNNHGIATQPGWSCADPKLGAWEGHMTAADERVPKRFCLGRLQKSLPCFRHARVRMALRAMMLSCGRRGGCRVGSSAHQQLPGEPLDHGTSSTDASPTQSWTEGVSPRTFGGLSSADGLFVGRARTAVIVVGCFGRG